MNQKLSLSVGINDYPGSGMDLAGCVNDALGWQDLLQAEDYSGDILLDADATHEHTAQMLELAMSKLRFGDRFVFTYSGHGSRVRDRNADEADGMDECLVFHDWDKAGFLTDDELWRIFQARAWGVRVMVISDSCHSGTVARFMGQTVPTWPMVGTPRYFPTHLLEDRTVWQPPRPRSFRPDTLLFSGCEDDEYSYDAYIDGKPQGAFSHAALSTCEPGISMRRWHSKIRTVLPNLEEGFAQHPQMRATGWQKRWSL